MNMKEKMKEKKGFLLLILIIFVALNLEAAQHWGRY